MKTRSLLFALGMVLCTSLLAQPLKTKNIDNGGTGMFKAIAVKESGMPDFVIYRPKDLMHAHARCGALPLLMFANGGCMDTSIGYERMLTEIASHGYIVMAIGEMQDVRNDRKESHTPSSELKRGLDWIVQQSVTKGSDYYQNIDTARIGAAGHSCGGAQVLANAADARLKTYLILNAGMGDMEMAGASKASLPNMHGPALYIVGGPSDVAFENAQKDYERITDTPVALADHPASGHGGTYEHPYGGDYGRMVIDWLDWQLKGEKAKAAIFLDGKLDKYEGWTIKAKNFKQRPGRIEQHTMPCQLLDGISEREYSVYLPGSYEEDTLRQYPVMYLMHGGGGAHTDWERHAGLCEMVNRLTDSNAIEDMMIVCPEGNKQNMMYFNVPQWRYEDYFFKELIPYIEKHYRVRTDKGGRAIAGFSMGGGAATVYGVNHPEEFAMVYNISGYLRRQPLDFLKNDPSAEWRQQAVEANNPIKRVAEGSNEEVKAWKQVDWVVNVGDQDFTLEGNMDMVKALRHKGIHYSMHVDAGAHDWNYVKPALEDALIRANKNFESLWIRNGERHLYGVLSRPAHAKGKMPVAIIAHGFNGTHHFGRNYFDALNKLGYQVYTFDFACGSVNSRSDNNTMNMSILDEQSDLEAIVRYFKQQPDVDASRIVLIGESQGGLVSALTAASMPKEISRTILIFPALCIPDNWTARYPNLSDIPDTTRLWNVPMGRRFFTEVRDINVFKRIGKYKRPVLIVQGDKDPVVSMKDSERAVKIYKDARLHVIPGAGHGFKPKEFEESIYQIVKFLTEDEKK